MTGTEGETAVLALAVCAVTPWVLFVARIWKVTTVTKPRKPDPAASGAAVTPVTEPVPITEGRPGRAA